MSLHRGIPLSTKLTTGRMWALKYNIHPFEVVPTDHETVLAQSWISSRLNLKIFFVLVNTINRVKKTYLLYSIYYSTLPEYTTILFKHNKYKS